MSRAHDDLVNEIMLYVSEIGGVATQVDTPGLLYTREGHPVKIGTKGVLDIEATIPKTIAGRRIGVSVKIDAKIGKDRLRTEQVNYANAVNKAGGIAFAARSVDDVKARLQMEGLIDG